ncbi:ABC transporter permease [Pseudomonas sp. UBA2628]|uniref:ABC transporter permease n=1 Tax=Pseudomonas sp. UBA2628 TaxID=1947310 RepID=UPI00257E8166|nr:ABC transporter permease [Pseudomonas sp. UBA2628]
MHDVHDHEAERFIYGPVSFQLYALRGLVLRLHLRKRRLFGLSFYLIGRRESGFVRSFIYRREAITLFLTSHALSYSVISLLYSSAFYIITKPLYGPYSLPEFLHLTTAFYTSYLLFSCIGLAIAALPIRFSTAGTVFSFLSFLMLFSGYLGSAPSNTSHWLGAINPLYLSANIINGQLSLSVSFSAAVAASAIGFYVTAKLFRIQPIWNRY